MRCAILYHLYNLQNVKNTHGRVLLLIKLQLKKACYFTKTKTSSRVFLHSPNGMVANRAKYLIYIQVFTGLGKPGMFGIV